mmetsp:Transcript_7363/g.28995  ORF Transcript_7363/g.28995 Transcript_7363/m.28995 type:complete len:375 (-) Transcript_7363:587-1711(-)
MAATPEVGKSRYLAASHAVAAVVPSSSLGLAPLPPLDATVASSTSADRTRSAAWCVPAASGFLFRLAWYLLTAHSRAIRRSTASAAALRPLHRQKGTRRSEAAASRATVHHPDASSSVGRRLRMASTPQTTISSRNCTASAAAAALAASARSLSRAPPSSAVFLLEPPKYPVFSFFSFAAVSSATFTAKTAAAAALRGPSSSSRYDAMISPSGDITMIASGCVRMRAWVERTLARTATRRSGRSASPVRHLATSWRITCRGWDIGMDGRALAMANEMDAFDMGATADPAPHPCGSASTDEWSAEATSVAPDLGFGLAASRASASTNSRHAASPFTAGTASYTVSSASHAAEAQSRGCAFCGSEPDSARRPIPAA